MKSFSDLFETETGGASGLQGGRSHRSETVAFGAALLVLMVTILVGASVAQLRAAHGMGIEEAFTRAVQFQGDPRFLAP